MCLSNSRPRFFVGVVTVFCEAPHFVNDVSGVGRVFREAVTAQQGGFVLGLVVANNPCLFDQVLGLDRPLWNVHAAGPTPDRRFWALVVRTIREDKSARADPPPFVVFGDDRQLGLRVIVGADVFIRSRPRTADELGVLVHDDFDQLPQLFSAMAAAEALAV